MTWRDFVDVEMIAASCKHASGALAIIVGFVIIASVAKWIIHDEYVSRVIEFSEKVVVTACVQSSGGGYALETRYDDV